MKTRILTIGTASVSTLIRCDGIPRPGCTVTAERYSIRPGGRAVISSVAISKLGGDSIVCSSVGEDSYAVMLEDFLGSFCVDRRFYVKKNGCHTGYSTIIDTGRDAIIDIPGANLRLSDDDIGEAFTCLPDAALVRCGGASVGSLIFAVSEAVRRGVPVVLDLCGVSPDLPLESLRRADVVIVDADTAEMLTGTLPSGEQSGLRVSGELERRIHTRYTVLMLSDTKGIFLSDNKYHEMLLPFDVSEVDRSGADDSFISALTYDYATRVKAGGRDIGHACTYAALAKAWTRATKGLIASLPTDSDLRAFAEANNVGFKFYD